MEDRAARAHDVIIVGAGHNGLVAAGYLAKDGLRVCVLERAALAGGLSRSADVFVSTDTPGDISVAAAWSGMLQPTVQRTLRLTVPTVPLEPQHVYVGTNGAVHHHPLSPRERERFYSSRYGTKRVAILGAMRSLEDRMMRTSEGLRRVCCELSTEDRKTRIEEMGETANAFLLAPMTQIFSEHDGIPEVDKAAMAQAAMSLQNGPVTKQGGGFYLSYMAMASTAGVRGAWGLPRQGMGAVASEIRRRAVALGAMVRTSTAVVAVEPAEDGFIVRTDDGEYGAKSVLFACGLHRVGPLLGRTLSIGDETSSDTQAGLSATLHFRLGKVPAVARDLSEWLGGNRIWQSVLGHGPSTLAGLSQAASVPCDDAFFSSPLLLSASLLGNRARPVLYVYAQFVGPRAPHTELIAAVVSQLDGIFPGFESLVEEARVSTPSGIAEHLDAPNGHPEHYQMEYPELLSQRPSYELSEYRLPEVGLYHGSAGSFPGGLVTGLPGRNAALTVLDDFASTASLSAHPGKIAS